MATKKEMVAELVALGANEAEIKDLKNTELEAMLQELSVEQVGEGVVEVVEVVGIIEPKAPSEPEDEAQKEPEPESLAKSDNVGGEVVRETSQQLGIFSDYIYNVRNKGADVVIENLGYGDVYYSTEGVAVVGKVERLLFKESVRIEGATVVYFSSASQPVVQILEVK